jgi:hypothetical protein
MSKNNEPFNKLGDKIESTEKYLIGRIDECIKKSEVEQHYATKHYVLTCGALLIVSICSAYWLVTPIIINSENKQFETKLEKIDTKVEELLEILKK